MFNAACEGLCQEFQTFIGWEIVGRPDSEYIEDYLFAWFEAEEDCAVVAVGGDYTLYLQVVIAIIDRCMQDPHFLDYKGNEESGPRPRPVKGVVDPEHSRAQVLDPHYFQNIVFWLQTRSR